MKVLVAIQLAFAVFGFGLGISCAIDHKDFGVVMCFALAGFNAGLAHWNTTRKP